MPHGPVFMGPRPRGSAAGSQLLARFSGGEREPDPPHPEVSAIAIVSAPSEWKVCLGKG